MIFQISEFLEKFNNSIIFDNSLIMAIIAINMTVIGLTSLADKKTVIGIDYGDFLIKEFKFLKIRMYYWLILFAMVNVLSLFFMFVDTPIVRIINFILLLCSLIFAIIYFFSFILIENRFVVKQIYIRELLGLYCDSNNTEHFSIDTIVKMHPGTRTSRKISTNVINFFNNYNSITQNVFEEVFGPDSLIYSDKSSITKCRKKIFNTYAYKYRQSGDNPNIKDISFEFFQLYRFVDNQEKWIIDILRICNGGEINNYKDYDIFRLYNFARVTAQINVFGDSKNLYKYKFLFNYRYYWYATVDKSKDKIVRNKECINHIIQIENEIVISLFNYIIKGININKNKEFIDMTKILLREITLNGKYNGYLNIQDIYDKIIIISLENECIEFNNIIEDILNESLKSNDIKIDYKKLQEKIIEIEKEKNRINKNRIKIFNNT